VSKFNSSESPIPSIPVSLEVLNLIRLRNTGEICFSLGMRKMPGGLEKTLISFPVGDARWLLNAIEQGFVDLKELQSSN